MSWRVLLVSASRTHRDLFRAGPGTRRRAESSISLVLQHSAPWTLASYFPPDARDSSPAANPGSTLRLWASPSPPHTPRTPAHSPRSSGDILQPSARQTPGPRVSIWTHQSRVPVTTLKHSSSDDQEMRVGPWRERRLPPRG